MLFSKKTFHFQINNDLIRNNPSAFRKTRHAKENHQSTGVYARTEDKVKSKNFKFVINIWEVLIDLQEWKKILTLQISLFKVPSLAFSEELEEEEEEEEERLSFEDMRLQENEPKQKSNRRSQKKIRMVYFQLQTERLLLLVTVGGDGEKLMMRLPTSVTFIDLKDCFKFCAQSKT